MIKYISREEYSRKNEALLQRYESVGLTPLDCLNDVSNGKLEVGYADGYADAALIGGISLTLAGLICKWLANRECKHQGKIVRNHLAYAEHCQNLAEMAQSIVPHQEDEDREENNE